ncbi:MAG: T9SS type A sorting domain-containing protein [Bacteroidia bacterium]|jgi:hypothetical protein
MKPRFTFLLLLHMCLCVQLYAQTHYFFNGSNELHVTANWGTDTTGGGNQPPNFNQPGDTFEIRNTVYIMLTADWTVNGSNAKIILGDGFTPVHLVVPDSFACSGSITVKQNCVLTLSNSVLPILDTLFANTTLIYAANGDQSLSDKTYYNLEIKGTGTKTATGDLSVSNLLTVDGILDLNAASEDLYGTFTEVQGKGLIRTESSGIQPIPKGVKWNCTVEFYRSGTGTQNIPTGNYNKLYISGGSGSRNANSGNLTVDSVLRIEQGTTLALNTYQLTGILDSLIGSGTLSTQHTGPDPLPANRKWPFHIVYSASANQTVRSGIYLQNLGISTGGIKEADGPITVNGNLSVTGSTFNLGNYPLSGELTGVSGITGILQTFNVSENPLPSNKVWTQTVMYAGNSTQYIATGTYNNLSLNTAPKKCLANGPLTVYGTFILSQNDTLEMQTYPLQVNALSSGNGVLKTACTDIIPVSSGKNWNGIEMHYASETHQYIVNGQYNTLNIAGGPRSLSTTDTIKITGSFYSGTDTLFGTGSVVALTGTSSQNLSLGCSGQFGSLCLLNGTNKIISGGDLTVDELLFIKSGVNLVMGSNRLTGSLQTISGTGTLITLSGVQSPIPSGKIWPIAVTYAGSSIAQTIVEGIYASLSITSGSDVNRANGNIEIMNEGQLQISSNNVLDLGTYVFIIGEGITNGGAGTIRTQHTGSEPLTPNCRWTQHVSYNGNSAQHVVHGTYLGSLTVNGGDRTFSSTGIIEVAGTFTASSNVDYTTTNSNFSFNGNSNQQINLLANFSFNQLQFAGNGIKSINNPIIVLDKISIEGNATVNLGPYALTGDNLITEGSSTGTFRTQNSSAAPWPSSKVWNFRILADGDDQFIVSGSYQGGLTIAGNASRKKMLGSVTIGDTFSIYTSNALEIGPNTLTLTGMIDATQTGTISGGVNSDIIIDSCIHPLGFLRLTQDTLNSRTVRNITLNRNPEQSGDAVILGNELRLLNTLTLLNGTLNSNGMLVFLSNGIHHSAQLAPISGTGNISGSVMVQRALGGKAIATNARWRFVSAPVDGAQSIAQSWQQQIHITGPGTGGTSCPLPQPNSNGFDITQTQNPSMFSWNRHIQNWEAVNSTINDSIACGKGYRLFFRGKRTQGCPLFQINPPDPQDTVLTIEGKLKTGPVNIVCASQSGGYELVGNPYQATIDWLSPDIIKTNLLSTIFSFRDNISASGAYASYTSYPIPDSTNGMSRFISPGTAFFVQTKDSGFAQLSFNESAKVITRQGESFFKQQSNPQHAVMRIRLYADSAANFSDEAVLRLLPGSVLGYDSKEDVLKFQPGNHSVSLWVGDITNNMSICRIPPLTDSLLYVGLSVSLPVAPEKYRFVFDAVNSFDPEITLELVDQYLGTSTNLKQNQTVTFETLTDSASCNPQRFVLRMRFKNTSTTLPEIPEFIPDSLLCYPVPARNKVYLPKLTGQRFEVQIFSMDGRLQLNNQISNRNEIPELDISSLQPGIFILEIHLHEKVLRYSLVKE